MIPPTRASLCLALALVGGCDKIQALIGGDETKTAEAGKTEAKTEAKTDAKTDAKTEAKAAAAPEAKAAAPAPTEAAPPAAAPAPTEAAPPAEVVATPAAAATPCIVGRWKAIEYVAEIRRAIASDPQLSKMKRSAKGGLLGYEIKPPTDGKGTVAGKAEDLRYTFTGKVEGFDVTLTFTLDGESEAEYTLEGDDVIVVSKPSKDTFVARASAKVKGFGKFSKSPKVAHSFSGKYVYECTDKTLKVWRDAKTGEALDFEREAP